MYYEQSDQAIAAHNIRLSRGTLECGRNSGKDSLNVDYFSRWMEVLEVHKNTTEAVVRGIEIIIARLGFSITIRIDNGPCSSNEAFRGFTKPHYPESNGLAER